MYLRSSFPLRSLAFLLPGAALYLFLRPYSALKGLVEHLGWHLPYWGAACPDWLRASLPSTLWILAFCTWLDTPHVSPPRRWALGLIPLVLGLMQEASQASGLFKGTFSWDDVAALVLGWAVFQLLPRRAHGGLPAWQKGLGVLLFASMGRVM